jgi:GLPGLI family protein
MKTLLSTLTLAFVFSANAQNFKGKAIYKTSMKSNFKISAENNPGMDENMQEEIRKRMQKMNQKTYVLEFNKYNSTYTQKVSLDAPKTSIGKISPIIMSFGGTGNSSIYYKNIQEKRFVNQTEIMGKRFLVKDKLPEHPWKLSSETKHIGNYTCYKATYSKEVENKNITFKDGDSVESIKKETIVTTAWYTPQIPVSNGPGTYQGLPGLILEINDGKKVFVCTEIILNSSEKTNILEPTKGKIVSQNKFIKIQIEKSDELMEKFKGRNGLDLGNGINIKIGG